MEHLDMTKFNKEQLEQLLLGSQEGLDVWKYASPKFDHKQMEQIRLGLEDKLDVSVYSNPEFNSYQMNEIRTGLLHGVNVNNYAVTNFSACQMEQIRLALEDGIDISMYISPECTWEYMKKVRLDLKFKHKRDMVNKVKRLGVNQEGTDPDTILADILDNADESITGIAKEFLDIWGKSIDKKSVEAIFHLFTEFEFTEYLQICINQCSPKEREKKEVSDNKWYYYKLLPQGDFEKETSILLCSNIPYSYTANDTLHHLIKLSIPEIKHWSYSVLTVTKEIFDERRRRHCPETCYILEKTDTGLYINRW